MGGCSTDAAQALSSKAAVSRPADRLVAKRRPRLARRYRPRELPCHRQITSGPIRESPDVPSAGMHRHMQRATPSPTLLPRPRTWPPIGRPRPVQLRANRRPIRAASSKAASAADGSLEFGKRPCQRSRALSNCPCLALTRMESLKERSPSTRPPRSFACTLRRSALARSAASSPAPSPAAAGFSSSPISPSSCARCIL
jgi:hypothetical protein